MQNALCAVKLHGKITAMYTRCLSPLDHSFFLFGPRSTGKTTWLRRHYEDALWFNLLREDDLLPLLGNVGLFRQKVLARPFDTWVVIDEVQKHPPILNEVHDLISLHGARYRFAITGSSARKLRRLDVNLLAGRVIERRFFPLTAEELGGAFDLERVLAIGSLPAVYDTPAHAVDLLEAYVGTYLREEIRQEALVRDLGSFTRFLRIAALMNAQVVSLAGVSRDCGVARTTAERYFETLVDTLVGFWLPPWQRRIKAREAQRPKFFFFDPGVVRVLANRVRSPLGDLETGPLLETYLFHELRAAMSYQNTGGELSYWRSAGGLEVDAIWSRGDLAIGFEFKASAHWRRDFGKALRHLVNLNHLQRGYVVYRGTDVLKEGQVEALPVEVFLKRLAAGNMLA